MTQRRGRFIPCLAGLLGLAFLAATSPARADFLIQVTDPTAGTSFLVFDNDGNDTNAAVGEISVNPTWANEQLGTGRAFDIVTLGASSNRTRPGENSALLTTSGQLVATEVEGLLPIQIDTTDTDYLVPGGPEKRMFHAYQAVLTNTGGGDNLSTVGFNNSADGDEFTIGPFTFTDDRRPFLGIPELVGDVGFLPIVEDIPFALAHQFLLTTSPSQDGRLRSVQFLQTTGKVPEPASMALLGLGLPLGLYLRHRRQAAPMDEAAR